MSINRKVAPVVILSEAKNLVDFNGTLHFVQGDSPKRTHYIAAYVFNRTVVERISDMGILAPPED